MNLGFGNNIKSALATDINATQTVITVMPGTGDLFTLTLNTDLSVANTSYPEVLYSKLTLTDVQESVFEICHLLSCSGDNLTVIRGQEGTTAKGWSLNDVVSNFATRGSENTFVQIEDLQNGKYLTAPAGGTENALTVELPSTFYINGVNTFALRTPITIFPSLKNTGACTVQLTMSGMIVGTYPIYKGNGQNLTAGDINPNVGFTVIFCPAIGCFQILNPANGIYDLSGYLPLTGGILSGDLTVNATTRTIRLAVGDLPSTPFDTGKGINIGDSDSGLLSGGDGIIYLYANGQNVGYWESGGLAHTGSVISKGGTLITQASSELSNCHAWFHDENGIERAVIWADPTGVLFLRAKNGSASSITGSGDIHAGSSFYENNGERVYSPNNPPPVQSGSTNTGNSSSYYTHANGQVFAQAIGNVYSASNSNPDVTVYLPASFPNAILGIGGSFSGAGGGNEDSWWTATAISSNSFNLHTRNMTGTFSFTIFGY